MKKQQITINNIKFIIESFNASEGLKILQELIALISTLKNGTGDAIGQLVSNDPTINEIKIIIELLLNNINPLVTNLDIEIFKRLVARCQVKTDQKQEFQDVIDIFDELFSSNYDLLFQLTKEVLAHNFLSLSTLFPKNQEQIIVPVPKQ